MISALTVQIEAFETSNNLSQPAPSKAPAHGATKPVVYEKPNPIVEGLSAFYRGAVYFFTGKEIVPKSISLTAREKDGTRVQVKLVPRENAPLRDETNVTVKIGEDRHVYDYDAKADSYSRSVDGPAVEVVTATGAFRRVMGIISPRKPKPPVSFIDLENARIRDSPATLTGFFPWQSAFRLEKQPPRQRPVRAPAPALFLPGPVPCC
ncbi:Uncharacterised protein [uncultured archaeon]|nr:Uncharacterised protein [uncultured archaeon]